MDGADGVRGSLKRRWFAGSATYAPTVMRRTAPLALVASMVLALVGPAGVAEANDAGTNIANFAESRGCDPHIGGTPRPNVGVTGAMPIGTQIRGPWGDTFGRTYYQVEQSLVSWRLPGSNKILRVHARVLPALLEAEASLNESLALGRSYGVYSAGSWVWRTVGGTFRPSEHALGTAFDINPANNPYSRDNRLRTNLPSWFVAAFVDAGFCWGGDWVDVKDAMHFSWSGPSVAPSSGRPAPFPPATAPSGFRGGTRMFSSALDVDGGQVTIADVTGEGAPDVIKLQTSGRIEAAGAVGDYRRIALRASAGTGSPDMLVGDYDLDGRPDVWVPDRTGSSTRFDVWTWASDYDTSISVPTTVPTDATHLMLGHFDQDYIPDVFAVTGDHVSIFGSVDGYDPTAVLPIPSGADPSWSFVTGDFDIDGVSDVYAIFPGSAPRIRVSLGRGGQATANPATSIASDAAVGLGDYDGDGRDDLFVMDGRSVIVAFGGSSSLPPDTWFQTASSLVPDAGPECVSAPCDTIGYVDAGGLWTLADRPRYEATGTEFFYGNPNDVPFMGDWNCDGTDTPGLYRRSDGFVYLRNANTQGVADREFYFGNPSDEPLVGDFNGDGCDTVSVFRPSEHRIYVVNALGADQQGLGEADYSFSFGDYGDVPFVGDFDGDGEDEVAVHRPSSGQVFLTWDLEAGPADAVFSFGERADVLLAGDWDGDGVDTLAAYRESEGNWYIRSVNGPGPADHIVHFHAHDSTSLPIVGGAFS